MEAWEHWRRPPWKPFIPELRNHGEHSPQKWLHQCCCSWALQAKIVIYTASR